MAIDCMEENELMKTENKTIENNLPLSNLKDNITPPFPTPTPWV
jgi:hypothetical protein